MNNVMFLYNDNELPAKISQQSLIKLDNLKSRISGLKDEIKCLTREYEGVKGVLLDKYTKGCPVEKGSWNFAIKETVRHVPSWRTEFIKVMGERVAEEVKANTKPTITFEIVVRKGE